MRRLILFLLLLVMTSGAALAQSGGQLWVRAFEDRNGNGVREANEPLLTRGVSVNLLNAEGVIIATGLLDNSPNASQGLVGFQMLPPGQYSVVVTSADYTPTAGETFVAEVSASGVPPVLEYGGQAAAAPETASTAVPTTDTTRLVIAGAGAAAVILVMVILGFLVYMLTLRRRMNAAKAADARLTTGSMRAVRTGETGQFRTATGEIRRSTGEYRRPPGTGEYPRSTGEQRKP